MRTLLLLCLLPFVSFASDSDQTTVSDLELLFFKKQIKLDPIACEWQIRRDPGAGHFCACLAQQLEGTDFENLVRLSKASDKSSNEQLDSFMSDYEKANTYCAEQTEQAKAKGELPTERQEPGKDITLVNHSDYPMECAIVPRVASELLPAPFVWLDPGQKQTFTTEDIWQLKKGDVQFECWHIIDYTFPVVTDTYLRGVYEFYMEPVACEEEDECPEGETMRDGTVIFDPSGDPLGADIDFRK